MSRNNKQHIKKEAGSNDPAFCIYGRVSMSKKKKKDQQSPNHFFLKTITPLTENQETTFEAFEEGKNLILHGMAGTGKTYISLYLALDKILNDTGYKKIVIIRSVVPTRDMGFLPGGVMEKSRAYEAPYKTICDDLFSRGDGYDVLKSKHLIEFTTTSFLRGNTFEDMIVIVDEVQNMGFRELNTIITRIGKNCQVIFSGDYTQTDLEGHDKGDLLTFLEILDRMKEFRRIEFDVDDIVRSGLVKSYILAKKEYESSRQF